MNHLFKNRILNAAAKFIDAINKLAARNSVWYKKKDSALKIKFHKDLNDAYEAANKLNTTVYTTVLEDNLIKDLKSFQNTLQISSITTFELAETYNPNEKAIAEAFGSKINNINNELTSAIQENSALTNDESIITETLNKFHYDLNFYFNAKNIPNQNLVFETYNYFEKGDGEKFFEPLDFFNLFYWNYEFVNENIDNPFDIVNHIRLLPLNDIKKHLIIAFILKWFGGVPVNNLNAQYNTTLKIIEKLYFDNLDSADIENSGLNSHKKEINSLHKIISENPQKEKIERLEKIINSNIHHESVFQEKQNDKPYVFISHSSKDASIVKEFTDKILQLILKLDSDEIFCTSIEEFSITSGDDFRQTIKEKLQRASHVIQIITVNYKKSEVCLNEMGAAWVLNTKVKPFILDPINYDSVGFIN